MQKPFLTAEWQKLVMANYAIEPTLLQKYLPHKTEIDLWEGTCYLSLVGFMFQNTKLLGFKIPFHVNFEEVNLRFYVRYKDQNTWKRGVVFVKEIVPKPALSWVANTVYKEHYETLPMRHTWTLAEDSLSVSYAWKKQRWHELRIITNTQAQAIEENSEEAFITEHYWGYTKLSDKQTAEYGVEHPSWEVYQSKGYEIDVDFGLVYGSEFAFLDTQKPQSVFLAEGSPIAVKRGRRL